MQNKIIEEDVQQFAENFELWELLRGKSFLITGATGLIGSVLTKCLIKLNRKKNLDIKIIAVGRNFDKAKKIFGEDFSLINFLQLPLTEINTESVHLNIDYIVHLASPTNGKYMENHPVETFSLAYESTNTLLKYGRQIGCKGFLFVSSVEYYGQILEDKLITEEVQGYVDSTSARSSYPLGKRAAEYLCFSNAKEYGFPAKIARLTQTFGAGVSADDNRVFAQFARSVMNGKDIVLHTKGESAKPYCYTTDCVAAILYILLRGNSGHAYNVANEETYITIKEMAVFLKENFNPNINVRIELDYNMGYAPVTKMRLSSERLRALGWEPHYGLKAMFERLIMSLRY